MTTRPPDLTRLDLTGLATRPAQVWGAVRLVPLVRAEPIDDLRLDARLYGEEAALGMVQVAPRTAYISYIPHGFVATWTRDRTPAAAYGTQLQDPRHRGDPPACMPLRFHRRMARRTEKDRLRFLPLHLALEGYLALHFGGPEVAWQEWSQRAIRRGLSPRVEQAYVGLEVAGLEDALRVFEIHPGQCGVLVYLADALATAFVVPHPADYRALHATLLQDLYGELIYHYATLNLPVQEFRARLADVDTFAGLRAAAARQCAEWADFHDETMAGGLLDESYSVQHVYRMGRFTLCRFLPPFHRQRENHIGEAIVDRAGQIAYLKTFRLSENQVRRGHLLTRLAAHDWHLARTAKALGITEPQLGIRLNAAGFGHLLRRDVLDHYRAELRRS